MDLGDSRFAEVSLAKNKRKCGRLSLVTMFVMDRDRARRRKNGNQWVFAAKAVKSTRAGDESTQYLCYFLLPRFLVARKVINCYATGAYKA